jgi:hypothetical protein
MGVQKRWANLMTRKARSDVRARRDGSATNVRVRVRRRNDERERNEKVREERSAICAQTAQLAVARETRGRSVILIGVGGDARMADSFSRAAREGRGGWNRLAG